MHAKLKIMEKNYIGLKVSSKHERDGCEVNYIALGFRSFLVLHTSIGCLMMLVKKEIHTQAHNEITLNCPTQYST